MECLFTKHVEFLLFLPNLDSLKTIIYADKVVRQEEKVVIANNFSKKKFFFEIETYFNCF